MQTISDSCIAKWHQRVRTITLWKLQTKLAVTYGGREENRYQVVLVYVTSTFRESNIASQNFMKANSDK